MIKVAVFGVGLIGGSLALCFKDKPNIQVVGHSPNPSSVDKYMKLNVVDYATTSIQEAAADADFIFLCVPVGMLESYLQQLHQIGLKPGCIVTDVGSTKVTITDCAKKLSWNDVYFIGGHPMAGKEQSGAEAATSHLFENAFYVLTPDEQTPAQAVQRLVDLLQYTRAQIVTIDALLHDDIVGAISHLPHIIAVALVNQISAYNESNDLYQSLAAGGFRDITRIASCDPIIWRDILVNNRTILLKLLQDWNDQIAHFIQMLDDSDGVGIEKEFARANHFRSQLPERRKGVLTSFYDIYVDVPDHPGIIGQIASLLGDEGINLSNIQIIESRAEVPGVLRLSFRSQSDLDRATVLLKQHQYRVNK